MDQKWNYPFYPRTKYKKSRFGPRVYFRSSRDILSGLMTVGKLITADPNQVLKPDFSGNLD